MRVFICEDPETVTRDFELDLEHHAAPWQWEVQKHVRKMNPPAYPPEFVYVGYDDDGLAAVIEMRVNPSDYEVFVAALAVAHRTSRHGLAGEALERVSVVADRYEWSEGWVGLALIDPRNTAAKTAFEKAGFAHEDDDGPYERWRRDFEPV